MRECGNAGIKLETGNWKLGLAYVSPETFWGAVASPAATGCDTAFLGCHKKQ
jgi:hypothetical protein